MRFLQSLGVPLLLAGTLAKTQIQARDIEAVNTTDTTAGVENAGSSDNFENVDNSVNLEHVDISDDVDDLGAGVSKAS